MYIQLWEPSKQRRLRVKNRTRFVVFLLIVLTLLLLCIPECAKSALIERIEVTKQQLAYWLK